MLNISNPFKTIFHSFRSHLFDLYCQSIDLLLYEWNVGFESIRDYLQVSLLILNGFKRIN